MRHVLLCLFVVGLMACDGTAEVNPTPDATSDAESCVTLQDVGCDPNADGEPGTCPEGYTCSGLSAFLCYKGTCNDLPICLPADAMIDTPSGPIPMVLLKKGMLVWTQTRDGLRVAAPVEKLGRIQVPGDHKMVHMTLSDGRSFRASPNHPGADGSALVDLSMGDTYDGALVVTFSVERYEGSHTYDLLPAGETGQYWVNGVLLGSTLTP